MNIHSDPGFPTPPRFGIGSKKPTAVRTQALPRPSKNAAAAPGCGSGHRRASAAAAGGETLPWESRVELGFASSAWLELPPVSAALAARRGRREQPVSAEGLNGSFASPGAAALGAFFQTPQHITKTLLVLASQNSKEGVVFPGWHRLSAR